MKTDERLRKEILNKVKKFHEAKISERFMPGISKIRYGGRVYDEKELINLVDSSLDFWLTAGRYTEKFEKKLAKFLGVKYALMVNSGSSANLLAVSALTSPLLKDKRLRPGDEVITTACGFPTTLNPIIQNGLVPVLVDVEPGTYNIRTDMLRKALSKKTGAIFTAHTLGNPAGISEIAGFAKKHGLWLIEDNCDSLGSRHRGRHTGTFGHISTASFYPPHHITTGEGGAVLTSDPLLRKIALSMRDWGRDCWCDTGCDNTCGRRFAQRFGSLPFGYDHKYVYSHIGYNLKATDMQAAIGVAQLEKLPGFILKRKNNFKRLYDLFKNYAEYFILPKTVSGSDPSWFGFPLLVRDTAPFSREKIVQYLERNNIATRMLFGGNLTRQPAYKDIKCRKIGKLENTDMAMNSLFWLGVYPGITKEMMRYIERSVNEFLKEET